MQPKNIFIKDYSYQLPQDRIAEFPLKERDQSRLLIYKNGHIQDDYFKNINHYIPENALIILNDTRVIEARIFFQKPTGGIIEIFCLEPHQLSVEQALSSQQNVQWNCLIGGASKWKSGQILSKIIKINDELVELKATYIDKLTDSFIIDFSWQPSHFSFAEVLHVSGAIPLPPYIKREPVSLDAERYQTIFSTHDGSVAAPTASLHFTENVFEHLSQKQITWEYTTLHVGAGTFKPVKTEKIGEHQMHWEPFTASKKLLMSLMNSDVIIAAGTTSMRTMESLYWIGLKLKNGLIEDQFTLLQWEAYELAEKYAPVSYKESFNALISWMNENNVDLLHCKTSLMIVPGYQFKVPVGLITNFHQPQSTLLLLVSAFIGDDWKKVYQYAMDNQFRFLSYGDSSLLWRKT